MVAERAEVPPEELDIQEIPDLLHHEDMAEEAPENPVIIADPVVAPDQLPQEDLVEDAPEEHVSAANPLGVDSTPVEVVMAELAPLQSQLEAVEGQNPRLLHASPTLAANDRPYPYRVPTPKY